MVKTPKVTELPWLITSNFIDLRSCNIDVHNMERNLRQKERWDNSIRTSITNHNEIIICVPWEASPAVLLNATINF